MDDAPTPSIPDPFRDREALEAILNEPLEGSSSSNQTIWHHGPDRVVVEFYVCRPQTKCNPTS
jgi:hypothetical protein